jgi:hypothetical protein
MKFNKNVSGKFTLQRSLFAEDLEGAAKFYAAKTSPAGRGIFRRSDGGMPRVGNGNFYKIRNSSVGAPMQVPGLPTRSPVREMLRQRSPS